MRLSFRTTLHELGIGEIQLQNFGKNDELLIRFPEQEGGPEAQKVAADKVLQALPAGTKELRREQVGSTVSKELINSAIWALVLTNLVIFAYVWFRFEWQFALGAVVSLVHDVMVTIGVWSLFQLDFDLTIVAALLTILGYSINDTVVIYDSIRENLRKYKRMSLRRFARPFGERDDVADHHDRRHGPDGADRALLLRRRGHSRVHLRDALRRSCRHLFVGLYRSAVPDPDRGQARLERRGKRQRQGTRSQAEPPGAEVRSEPLANTGSLRPLAEDGSEVESIGFSASIPLGETETPAVPLPPAAPRKPAWPKDFKERQGAGEGRRGTLEKARLELRSASAVSALFPKARDEGSHFADSQRRTSAGRRCSENGAPDFFGRHLRLEPRQQRERRRRHPSLP